MTQAAKQSVLVVDDETPARLRLCALIEAMDQFEVVAQASHGQEALELCQQFAPDIVLMDIRMPGMDGLAAAALLAEQEQPPAVIFCTAYDEHALSAFESQAIGYLLKPVDSRRLLGTLENAGKLRRSQLAVVEQLQSEAAPAGAGVPQTIVVNSRGGQELIEIDEIRALVADKKYVSAFLQDREVLLDESLKMLETQYPEHFFRVHRNTLIGKRYLAGLAKQAGHDQDGAVRGDQYVVELRGTDIRPVVSRRLLPALRRLLKQS